MNKTEVRAVLKALELLAGIPGTTLKLRPSSGSPTDPVAMAHDAIRIMSAELMRPTRKHRVPHGWRLVPTEPTPEMLFSGHHRIDFDRSDQNTFDPNDENQRGETRTGTTCAEDLREAYQAMLDVAPEAPVKSDAFTALFHGPAYEPKRAIPWRPC